MNRHYSEALDEYFYDEDPDDPGTQFCLDCGEVVNIAKRDFGIGPYEFWGARGVDHSYAWVCPKCEGTDYINTNDAIKCHQCGKWIDKTKSTEDEDGALCDECTTKEG